MQTTTLILYKDIRATPNTQYKAAMTYQRQDRKRMERNKRAAVRGPGCDERNCAQKNKKARSHECDKWRVCTRFFTPETRGTSSGNPLVILTAGEYERVKYNCIELTNPHYMADSRKILHWDIQTIPQHMRDEGGATVKVGSEDTVHLVATLDCGILDLTGSSNNQMEVIGRDNIAETHNPMVLLATTLYSAKLKRVSRSQTGTQGRWDRLVAKLRANKPNLVKAGGKMHYGSTGQCYGFGYVASFKPITTNNHQGQQPDCPHPQSSVQLHARLPKGCPEEENSMRQMLMTWLRCCTATGVKEFGGNIVRRACVLYESLQYSDERSQVMGTKHCLENLQPAIFFNIDAATEEAHTEFDSTYTTIAAPMQVVKDKLCFHWILNGTTDVQIPLHPGRFLLYNAFLVTHRQQCDKEISVSQMNISAYGNKRLLSNAQRSYQRLKSTPTM